MYINGKIDNRGLSVILGCFYFFADYVNSIFFPYEGSEEGGAALMQ